MTMRSTSESSGSIAAAMVDMKCDMAGSAATLGIVFAAARLKLPIEVHAVVGSTENMTGAKAYRPGDVYKSYQGKTVEVINTDAEGRMVLADVLTWAARKLEGVVDLFQQVLGMEYLAAVQGLEFQRPLESSPKLEEAVARLRADVPRLEEDRFLAYDMRDAADLVASLSDLVG